MAGMTPVVCSGQGRLGPGFAVRCKKSEGEADRKSQTTEEQWQEPQDNEKPGTDQGLPWDGR